MTYAGIIVMVLGFLAQVFGVPFFADDVSDIVSKVGEVIGMAVALYGRYRIGGVSPLGKKPYDNRK